MWKTFLAFVALVTLLLVPSAARAQGPAFTDPDAQASGRVTFTAEPGLEPEIRKLAPVAARALVAIEADLEGLPRLDRVEVRLVKHAENLSAAAPAGRGAPPWAVGVAWLDAGVVAVAARAPGGALNDMSSTLAHELAHMALERALGPHRAPRWLHEGFAYQHSSDFEIGRVESLAGALFRGKLMPIDALEHAFPVRHDAVSLAYAESYDFVGFLTHRGRWPDPGDDGDRWPFRTFLQRVARGEPIDLAANATFGRNISELDAEWVAAMRARYVWYPIAALGGFFWVVLGGLAVLGWRRRRRQMRARLDRMGQEEAAAAAAAAASLAAVVVQAPGDGDGAAGEFDGAVATHVRVEESR